MNIGSYYSIIYENRISKFLISALGILDLHSHLRLTPIIKYFKKYLSLTDKDEIHILELGCGAGIVGFELYKAAHKRKGIRYVGIDLDEKAINAAKNIVTTKKLERYFEFIHSDANKVLLDQGRKYDIVLLPDIVEHIDNPLELLKSCKSVLHEDGLFIVSVPTPNYPKIFGLQFHKGVGHVVDGYFLRTLDEIFIENLACKREEYKYNTGLLSILGCYLNYNFFFGLRNKYLNMMKNIIFLMFKYLDLVNSPKFSASLFATYKKSSR